jgi:hypothetical protein
LLEQVGFVPRKKKPPVVDPTPVTPKKPKVKKVTPDPKKDPKKPELAKIKPGEDRIITPPENRKQHMIYNKASDGKWYWEVYSAYDDTLKTGLVTDGTVLAKLNTRNGTKKWDGKYKDTDCSSGVYIYILTYKFADQQTINLRGTFTLLR